MSVPADQLDELSRLYPEVQTAEEGGTLFYLIPQVAMRSGRTPATVDLLLCPVLREGYQSRLFVSQQVMGGPARNWNGNIRVLERNWFAVSWQSPTGLRLAQMVAYHLTAF